MKKWVLFLAGLLLAVGVNAYAADQEKDTILGKWLTAKGKSIVEVYHCGDAYCGKIVWLKEPLNKEGKDKVDDKNPDESLRTRKLIGLEILKGLQFKGPNKWGGGKIYDPDKGKTYKCKAWMEEGNLKFRGYIGFSLLGRTTTWTRK
ncbi:MAG: DUF2147 domain-containing protein [Deltaproteobacteria bacterium]|nr:DUF2147 domain-containing protein [Deltaproteobacteria bacterium]